MTRYIFIIITIIINVGCDSKRISELEKQIVLYKQQLNQKDTEISNCNREIEATKQYLTELKITAEKYEKSILEIKELENKINNFLEKIGQNYLIIPVDLIGKTVVVYCKPYENTQILIGTVKKISHADKVIISQSEGSPEIEIPFINIIGYRIIK
jgi:vacuolar-type H+-ATPase subunit I/STV1